MGAWEHAPAFLECLWSAQCILFTLSCSLLLGWTVGFWRDKAEVTALWSPACNFNCHFLAHQGRYDAPCSFLLPPLLLAHLQCIHPVHPHRLG